MGLLFSLLNKHSGYLFEFNDFLSLIDIWNNSKWQHMIYGLGSHLACLVKNAYEEVLQIAIFGFLLFVAVVRIYIVWKLKRRRLLAECLFVLHFWNIKINSSLSFCDIDKHFHKYTSCCWQYLLLKKLPVFIKHIYTP